MTDNRTTEQAIAATLGSETNPEGLPVGLTISEDGSLLNWRGENYIRQSTLDIDEKLAERENSKLEHKLSNMETKLLKAQERIDGLLEQKAAATLGNERIAELEAENERLRKAGYEIGYHDAMKAAKLCYATDYTHDHCKYSVNRGWVEDTRFFIPTAELGGSTLTAIDELKHLLDERGVAHSDHYLSTTWRDGHGIRHLAGEPMADGSLVVDMLTPEQAIAATLGGGECKVDGSIQWQWTGLSTYYKYELSCGHVITSLDEEPPNYCEECGAKVVE